MANRDVNLIIRAKNEASKTLGGVTDAIGLLKSAQDKLVASGHNADQSIGDLTGELDRLKVAADAAESLKKVESILGTMGATVNKLKGELTSAEQKLTQLGADSASTAQKIKTLEAESAKLAERQKVEKKAAEDAAKAIQKQAFAYQELKKAKSALERANALPAEAPNRAALIGAAQTTLGAKQSIFDGATAGSDAAKVALAETSRQLKAVGQQLKDLRSEQAAFAQDTDKTKAAIERQTQAVSKAEAEFTAITQEFAKASAGLSSFGLVTDTTEAKTISLMAQIERLGAVMKGIARYSTGGGSFSDPKSAGQMQKLNADRDAAVATQRLMQDEAKKLAMQIKAAEGDTSALVERMRQVTGAAAAAKAEAAQLAAQIHKASGGGSAATPTLDRQNRLLQLQSDYTKKVAQAERDAADASERLRQKKERLTDSMIKLNRESRQAMSVYQRIRGEVLSLASAYVGLFGTINSIGGVITSYQTMEAAQNRLGVVFGQNQQKTAAELQWLEGQAGRLGIQFGVLSEQYSKFAVSASAANFSAADTRKIFIALAEAGRVNKLSMDGMNGVFLAATQMIQKSKVSAEELRQQMAERLPGAVNIFADALGVTTAELSKMMEQGQVMADSDTMIKFANQLQKVFGPQLAASLAGTTKLIGDFQNNLFQGGLQVANGGFIDAFNRMMVKLNAWFKSKEGHEFFLSLGAAAGKVADALGFLIDNLDAVKIFIERVVAIKFAQWLFGVVSGLQDSVSKLTAARAEVTAFAAAQAAAGVQSVTFGARIAGVTGSLIGFGAAMISPIAGLTNLSARIAAVIGNTIAMTGSLGGPIARSLVLARSMTVLTGAVSSFSFSAIAARIQTIGLGVSMGAARVGAIALAAGMGILRGAVTLLRATMLALGGPLGLLIMIASFFAVPLFTEWLGGVEGATQALDEHQRIMSAVLEQYDLLKGKTDAWGRSVKSVTLDQANANLREMAARFDELKRKAASAATGTSATSFSYIGGFDGQAGALTRDLRAAGEALNDNQMSIDQYIERLNQLYSTVGDNQYMQAYIEDLLKSARAARDGAKDFSLAAEIASGFGSTIDLVARGLGVVPDRLKDVADAQDEANASMVEAVDVGKTYSDALDDLKSKVPQLADELARLKKITDLNSSAWTSLVAAWNTGDIGNMLEVLKLWGQGMVGFGLEAERNFNYEAKYTAERGTPQGAQLEELVASTAALAEQIGVSAKDLLTAMSYETAGTFDPWKAGPVTQWGQHYGLIQWGEPQAAKYGVTAESTIAQQVAAVGKYLLDAGVKPGDGLLQIYAAINAGSASNITASDANNGGAPGTVLDKVNDQMGAHKARAEGLLAAFNGTATASRETVQNNERITEELERQREATEKSLSDMGFENTLLSMRAAGGEKEAFIEERIRALKEQNKNLTAEQERSARAMLATQYDLNQQLNAEKDTRTDLEKVQERIGNLESQRDALSERRDIFMESGNTAGVQEMDAQIASLNSSLNSAIDSAVAMYRAMGGEAADAAIAKLETLKASLRNVDAGVKTTRFSLDEMRQSIFGMLENGVTGVFRTFAESIANGTNAVKSLGEAFRNMAANILIQLGEMIIQQALFNALSGLTNALTGGVAGLFGMVAHSGGIAGTTPTDGMREVSPAWFANASRYHIGGIAGLQPGEVPAVLKVGEEVLTEDNPRHIRNAASASSGKAGTTKIINAFDPASFLSEALSNVIGEEVILNYVRANPGAFKAAMEG